MHDLPADQREQLGQYLDLLEAANARMNLTRIRDRADAETFHVVDALKLLPFLPSWSFPLADVGSGGGVPGMVLAIARPDVEVMLIESVTKKAEFLRETAETIGLTNVRVHNGRAERLPYEQFDIVTSRAVAPLEKLLVLCRPLVRAGGSLLAMKGPKLNEELEAAMPILKKQRATVTTHPYDLGGQTGRIIAKISYL